MDSKVNRKERIFFLIGLFPVFWLCFKITGKVTQEQADIFTKDILGSLIEISPLIIFYSGMISTIFYLILYIFLYLVQQDNIHLLKLPFNEWEDRMYHMVILSSILTLFLSTLFCIVAVAVVEEHVIYNYLIASIISVVTIVGFFKLKQNLSEVKMKKIYDTLLFYFLAFFLSFSFVIAVINPIPQITIKTRFGLDGSVQMNTKSDEKIEHVILQILKDDEIKILEQKVKNFRTSGFYQTNKRKSETEFKQKEESRTYKINLAEYKQELLPMKKYSAYIIFEIGDEQYLLENEFFIKNKKFYFNEYEMKYKYKN